MTHSNSIVRRATGPRTERGKQNSKNNALKHGIFSQVVLLKSEARAKLNSLLRVLWRIRRLINEDREQTQEDVGLGALETAFGGKRLSLDLLLRCESNLERTFARTLHQLEGAQRMRRAQPVPSTFNVNVST